MGILRIIVPLVFACAASVAQPVLDVSTDTVNFGRVTPRQFVMGSVEVYNRGTDTLILRDIETSCGCTAATPDASRIAYMETATIRVSMNIEHKSGRFIQWIRLKSNDPKKPERDVYLKTDIVPFPDSTTQH